MYNKRCSGPRIDHLGTPALINCQSDLPPPEKPLFASYLKDSHLTNQVIIHLYQPFWVCMWDLHAKRDQKLTYVAKTAWTSKPLSRALQKVL